MGGPASPNDPVFFLHHANIDRLWGDWQLQENHWSLPYKGYLPIDSGIGGQTYFVNVPMKPWNIYTPASVADFYRIDDKGYKYDKYHRQGIKNQTTPPVNEMAQTMTASFDDSFEKSSSLKSLNADEAKSVFGSPENLKSSVPSVAALSA